MTFMAGNLAGVGIVGIRRDRRGCTGLQKAPENRANGGGWNGNGSDFREIQNQSSAKPSLFAFLARLLGVVCFLARASYYEISCDPEQP